MQRWVRLGMLVAVLVILFVGFYTVRRLDTGRTDWLEPLRSRFYLGVPWGTLIVVGFVLSVYLFVQDGRTSWSSPVTIPFRAWSYQYPLGMATAPFSHAGPGHLLGNLTGTLVLAPIAEYAWGHKPRSTDSGSISPVPDDPRLRAFVVFPLAVIAIGLLTSVFAVGPVIGFSGVVFALAGFAIVHYPIATIVGVLGVHGALSTTIRAIQDPLIGVTIGPSSPAPPSWATIAIQAHALGFFIGLLLGIVLLRHRQVRPDPFFLWVAVVLFGFGQSLWAIYWFGPEGTYYLFRGPGVLVVLGLSIVVTLAVVASDRPLLPGQQPAEDNATASPGAETAPDSSETVASPGRPARADITPPTRDRSTDPADRSAPKESPAVDYTQSGEHTTSSESASDTQATDSERSRDENRAPTRRWTTTVLAAAGLDRLTHRGTALLVLVLVLAAISGPALFVNAVVIDAGETESALTVADYHVTYDESVENQVVSIAPVEALGLDETVTTSGVIVWSDERSVWTDAVSANRLAFSGSETVELGGPGWRETVVAERTGWNVVGNESTYQVWLERSNTTRALAYESDSVSTDTTVAGYGFAVGSTDGTFELSVTRDNETVATEPIPSDGESISIEAVTVVREGDELYAEHDGTRVVIATLETYVE